VFGEPVNRQETHRSGAVEPAAVKQNSLVLFWCGSGSPSMRNGKTETTSPDLRFRAHHEP